jgi:putative membrane protein
MVIQVAGAGGTFPIEVLPTVYQRVYAFLPFTYGMNAMRECVSGMYENAYWIYLQKLLLFAVVSLFIGLILRIPFVRLNERIEKSKEQTDLMV